MANVTAPLRRSVAPKVKIAGFDDSGGYARFSRWCQLSLRAALEAERISVDRLERNRYWVMAGMAFMWMKGCKVIE